MVPGVVPVQTGYNQQVPVQAGYNQQGMNQFVYPGQVSHQVPGQTNFASLQGQLAPVPTMAQVMPPNVQQVQGVMPVVTQPSVGQLVPGVQAVMHQVVSQASSPGLLPSLVTNQGGVPDQSNQIIVQADVHSALTRSTETPFIKVTRKRVRKPAQPPSVKRLTPLRKVKVEQKKPKVSDVLNKSENQEEFASCPSGSEEDADITEVVLGNSF